MEDYKQRVIDERAEVITKRDKLRAFLPTRIFADLPAAERELLHMQLEGMNLYIAALDGRLQLWNLK